MLDILSVFYNVFDNPTRSRRLNRIYQTIFGVIVLVFIVLIVRRFV